jgi:hypothetical protein
MGLEVVNVSNKPRNLKKLRRLLGMVNYLEKFVMGPNQLHEATLTVDESEILWLWGPEQDNVFEDIWLAISTIPVTSTVTLQLQVNTSSRAMLEVL